jgi:aspartyl-tRNA(Asn)/glutamyl-tRNA(Gln) amidotransferase subunit B
MRSKEEANDYRYFPDPDLLPLELAEDQIERIRATLPELPDAKKHRFVNGYGLSPYDAGVLVAEQTRAEFYERVVGGKRDPKVAANWLITELLGGLNKGGHDIDASPISADALGELIDLLADNTISGRIAKDVFAEMFATGKAAGAIVEEKGLRQVTDTGAIDAVIDAVMAKNPDKVAEYRSGKDKLFGFFVGQVMKESGGKANPALVNQALKGKLAG